MKGSKSFHWDSDVIDVISDYPHYLHVPAMHRQDPPHSPPAAQEPSYPGLVCLTGDGTLVRPRWAGHRSRTSQPRKTRKGREGGRSSVTSAENDVTIPTGDEDQVSSFADAAFPQQQTRRSTGGKVLGEEWPDAMSVLTTLNPANRYLRRTSKRCLMCFKPI